MKKYVFLLMTAILIAFIWGNSLQVATHSSVESRWVLDLVQSTLSVIPGISHVTMYEIRKAAHVTEYMALGFFLSLVLSALNRRGRASDIGGDSCFCFEKMHLSTKIGHETKKIRHKN